MGMDRANCCKYRSSHALYLVHKKVIDSIIIDSWFPLRAKNVLTSGNLERSSADEEDSGTTLEKQEQKTY